MKDSEFTSGYVRFLRSPISPMAKLVFRQIAHHARAGGICFAKYKTLGEELNLSEDSICRSVAELKHFGLVKVKDGATRRNLEFIVADLEKWKPDQPLNRGNKTAHQPLNRGDNQPLKRGNKKTITAIQRSPLPRSSGRPMNISVEDIRTLSKVEVPPRVSSPKGDARRGEKKPGTASTVSARAGMKSAAAISSSNGHHPPRKPPASESAIVLPEIDKNDVRLAEIKTALKEIETGNALKPAPPYVALQILATCDWGGLDYHEAISQMRAEDQQSRYASVGSAGYILRRIETWARNNRPKAG